MRLPSSPYRTPQRPANTAGPEGRDPVGVAQRVAIAVVLVLSLLRVFLWSTQQPDFDWVLAIVLVVASTTYVVRRFP